MHPVSAVTITWTCLTTNALYIMLLRGVWHRPAGQPTADLRPARRPRTQCICTQASMSRHMSLKHLQRKPQPYTAFMQGVWYRTAGQPAADAFLSGGQGMDVCCGACALFCHVQMPLGSGKLCGCDASCVHSYLSTPSVLWKLYAHTVRLT